MPRHAHGKANVKSADPAATATYCFPSIAKDIGDEYTDAPHWKCQRAFPEAASSAMKFPSASPVKTSPPAVESTPDQVGDGCIYYHFIFPVIGSKAFVSPLNIAPSNFTK